MAFDLQALMAERRNEKFELFERHLNGPLVRVLRVLGYDVDYVRGEGPYLFDAKGNRYLDLLSGFGVFACGRNHPTVIAALDQVLHGRMAGLVQLDTSLLAGLLAERLVARMPWLEKLVFCNAGAEAVETALKLARAATGRTRILHCEHAFHGVTLGALSACGDAHFRERFGPFVGDFRRVPFNDLAALERALAEGPAAAFIVEEYKHAVRRGVEIYAEVLGVGAGCDGTGYQNGAGGTGLVRAIESALLQAGIDPREIGHINAHAASTPAGDLSEAEAIRLVFGERAAAIPVTSIKGAIGHCMGASGALETVAAVLSLVEQRIPPTRNYRNPDPAIGLDVVGGEPRDAAFSYMTKHSFGLGGQNACLVIGPAPANARTFKQ